jgi:hypothetical protein
MRPFDATATRSNSRTEWSRLVDTDLLTTSHGILERLLRLEIDVGVHQPTLDTEMSV